MTTQNLSTMAEGVTLDQVRGRSTELEDLVRLRFLAVVGLVALNALDLILTRELLARGASEANPLMALVIGGGWGVAIKLAVPPLFGLRHLIAPLERRMVLGLCWVNVLFLAVVAWNLNMLVHQYG